MYSQSIKFLLNIIGVITASLLGLFSNPIQANTSPWIVLETGGIGTVSRSKTDGPASVIRFDLSTIELDFKYILREAFPPEGNTPAICAKEEETITVNSMKIPVMALCSPVTEKNPIPQILYVPFVEEDEDKLWILLTGALPFEVETPYGAYDVGIEQFKLQYLELEKQFYKDKPKKIKSSFWRSMGDNLTIYKGINDLNQETRIFFANSEDMVAFGWYEHLDDKEEAVKYCDEGVSKFNLNNKQYNGRTSCHKDENGYFASHYVSNLDSLQTIIDEVFAQDIIDINLTGNIRTANFKVYGMKKALRNVLKKSTDYQVENSPKTESTTNEKKTILVCDMNFGDTNIMRSHVIDFVNKKVDGYQASINEQSIRWEYEKTKYHIGRYAGTIIQTGDGEPFFGSCQVQTNKKF
jgi:hypothetical protein